VRPTNISIAGDSVSVKFEGGGGCVEATSDLPGLVYVVGSDRRWHQAEVSMEPLSLIARSSQVPRPTAIRYAWLDNPKVGLRSCGNGLPISPFRSDDGPLQTVRNKKH
jgi:sialate O-acetylesterase